MKYKLYAAVLAPCTEDGFEINPSIIPQYAAFLKRNGVTGVFVNGMAGEGQSLSVNERIQVQAAWLHPQIKSLFDEVIISIAANSLDDILKLGKHAVNNNVSAISLMPPSYTPIQPTTVDDLVNYCATITNHFPETPFLYYHSSSCLSPQIFRCGSEISAAMSKRIPTFVAIKYTHYFLDDCLMCEVQSNGKYEVFFGTDELILASFASGIHQWIGSTYNFASNFIHRLLKSFAAGDLESAQEMNKKFVQLLQSLHAKFGSTKCSKALTNIALKSAGISLGGLRRPNIDLSAEEEQIMLKLIDLLDFNKEFNS